MGKSYRKMPVAGNTMARSEKKDKCICNRMLRRKVTEKLSRIDSLEDYIFPDQKEVLNTYAMAKDGKHYFDRSVFPKLMRK